jgi:hypothetical protein
MKKHNEYTEMGFRALKRAAKKVYEDARTNNIKIPIWKNGKVEYITPDPDYDPDGGTTENPVN